MFKLKIIFEGEVIPFGVSRWHRDQRLLVRLPLFLTWRQYSYCALAEVWGTVNMFYCAGRGFKFGWCEHRNQSKYL